jgi:uncharacterized membrane-anchored protein YitT (DUF2179 family)
MKSTKINWRGLYEFKSVFLTVVGLFFVLLALSGFMIPNHFLDGGVIGISLLIHEIFHIKVSLLLILGNLPFIFIGYFFISKELAIRSGVAIVILAIFLESICIPPITTNKLLISVFGGAFLGVGLGLIIRAGTAIDGTEILVVLTRRVVALSMSEVIMIINFTIFSIAAFKLGIETAMFSMITYFCAAKMITYVVEGIDQYTSLTVISSKSEEIKQSIIRKHRKGISIYKGERGFLPGAEEVKHECDFIVTVVTRLELLPIKKTILQIDPDAFIYVQNINEANGGVLKKANNH